MDHFFICLSREEWHIGICFVVFFHILQVSGLHFDATSGDCKSWCGGRNNGAWKMDEKISCLVDLQRRGEFHKVERGLMALLRNCLESDGENSRSILSGYVDHFQSIPFEDVGWGCV